MKCPKCEPGWMSMEGWPRKNKADTRPRQWCCVDCDWESEMIAVMSSRGYYMMRARFEVEKRSAASQ